MVYSSLNSRRSLLTPDDIQREQSFQLSSIAGWRGHLSQSTLPTVVVGTRSYSRPAHISIDRHGANIQESIALELKSIDREQ